MPCCDTGRNVQKYKGGGGGASTLQEALENGNISTLDIELQSSGLFIGDGGGLSNIAGVGGSVGNMQQVTTSGASTSNKIILTNTNESLQASGNVTVNSGKFYLGDGGLLSNTAGTVTLQQASNQGNVINNTISFTNAAESIVTTGKIVVGTSLEATNVNGNGSGLSSLNASNVSSGTIHNDRLSTKTGTGNIVMSTNPTLSGTITGGTFSGTHTGNGSGLTTLNASNISSGTLASDRLPSKTGTGNVVMSANPTLSGTITGGTFAGTHTGNGSGLTTLNATNISSGTLHSDRLPSKTGTGNVVLSANPTLSGTITGGTFAGTHTGNGSGLSSLNASNVSTGTLHNDRLSTKTGTGNIVMSTNPTLSGTITGGTFSGTHTGNGSGLSSLNASNVSTGTLSNDRLGTVPYNKGGTGQTSYARGDIIYSNANNSLAKLSIGTESGMFLRSDGTDVSWGTDGSRLTTINASNVSSGILTTSRGGTGNTFSVSKSDLLVGTTSGTFAKLSIPASSANGKILKINATNELFWGPDNTSTGSGGGGSGQLSLGSTFMNYQSGTDYNTSTGETINLNASTTDTANYIVVRDANKNINVTKVTLGSNTLTATEYSGKSTKVNVTDNNDNNAHNIPFLNSTNDQIVKDQTSKLTWTPQSNKITIGPSGTSNTLTNTTWSGKSDKVTISTNSSTNARPVLINEGDAVFKDLGNKFNWTPNPGTLTIGPISGTHSNITATTFTGTATKVAIGTASDDASKNIIFETGTNTIGTDTNTGFTYNPSTEVISIGSLSPATLSKTAYSGTASKVVIGTASDDASKNIIFETGTDTIGTDTNTGFTYNPSTEVISIGSSLPATLSKTAYSGTAAKVTVTNESNPGSDITDRAIPYLNGTILKSVASTLKYKPSTGTLSATKFSGNGEDITDLDPSALSGAVGSALGGTGQTGYTAGDILYASNDATPVLIKLGVDDGKFLKSTSSGVVWSPVSASTVPVTGDNISTSVHGITFAASTTGAQTIKSDQSTLHYKPSTGTLTTSNLITSDTSTNARNGISNGNPTHTLSVGTVVSIQETSTGDVLIVRGNGYFNDDVYIAKRLTIPVGGELKADTIKVRSLSQKGTLVVAERLVDTILAGS